MLLDKIFKSENFINNNKNSSAIHINYNINNDPKLFKELLSSRSFSKTHLMAKEGSNNASYRKINNQNYKHKSGKRTSSVISSSNSQNNAKESYPAKKKEHFDEKLQKVLLFIKLVP